MLKIRESTVKFAHVLFNFISLYLFVLTCAMKDANYKSHLNTLIFFDKKEIMLDLNMSHKKMSDFVSLSLFDFTLVIKLRNFDFEGH